MKLSSCKCYEERKRSREDGILFEMIEATGEFGIRKITDLVNRIYNSGYVPEAMRESVFIALCCDSNEIRCSRRL